MKSFLYITPYFPPNSRVGALRPLKFVRHIAQYGWEPVVFCDFRKNYGVNPELEKHLPQHLKIFRTYSRHASANFKAFSEGQRPASVSEKKISLGKKSSFWNNPELIPFGEHLADIPHAIREGRKILRETDCKAIVVNVDPFAAAYVGKVLSKEFGLPLIVDFRDPWSVCELRRPMRPAIIRHIVDRLEAGIANQAFRFILNTRTASEDYRRHYPKLPSSRFTFIRNFNDLGLIEHGSFVENPVKTILYLGNFRRFLEGEEVFEAISVLKQRGYHPETFKLQVFGQFPDTSEQLAKKHGVIDYISVKPGISYSEIHSLMEASDLLLMLLTESRQRLPAKFFDYVSSSKPILAITPESNTELIELVQSVSGKALSKENITGIADSMEGILFGSEAIHVDRKNTFSAQDAAKKLSEILNESQTDAH